MFHLNILISFQDLYVVDRNAHSLPIALQFSIHLIQMQEKASEKL
jgi:hypothetical protein